MTLNYVDLILAIIMAFSLFQGIRRGLIRTIFDVIGMIVSITIAIKYYGFAAEFITKYIKIDPFVLNIICFILIWILLFITIDFIGAFINRTFGHSFFGPINMFGGALFGFLKGLAIVLIAVQTIILFPLPSIVTHEFKDSIIFQWTLPLLELSGKNIYRYVPSDVPNINKFLENTKK